MRRMSGRMNLLASILSMCISIRPYVTQALAPPPVFSVPNAMDTFTSGLASLTRMPRGVDVLSNLPKDLDTDEQLVLYDLEGDKDCRAVREVITELDLIVTIVPRPVYEQPKSLSSSAKRKNQAKNLMIEDPVPQLEVKRKKGESMVLKGKDVITDYLFMRYTGPDFVKPEDSGNIISDLLPSVLRLGRGTKLSCAVSAGIRPRPKAPIVLYSYEGNQFCRLVREVLSELGISYELRSAGKGSPRRNELKEISGATQCPYLVDPNTGTKMSESKDIVRYLYQTYALFVPPSEALQLASKFVIPLLKPFFAIIAPLQAGEYDQEKMRKEIEEELQSSPVVIYTYKLSPFCTEALDVLKNIGIDFKEISLGMEWLPGLIAENGAAKRAELGRMTGQTSLPHIFVGGQSIGGLFSGKPGLIPSLEKGSFTRMVKESSPPLTRTLNL